MEIATILITGNILQHSLFSCFKHVENMFSAHDEQFV